MSTIEGLMRGNQTYAASQSSRSSQAAPAGGGTSGLSVNDFYSLLAAQLRYQDADNPMDTSEMMAQMVQTQMIQAISQMTTTNTISYASSMMGRDVTMAEVDQFGQFTGEETTGTITGVLLGDSPLLFIGDKTYYLAQLMAVGTVPDPPEDTEGEGDTGEGDTGGDTGGDDGNTETV